MKEVPEGEDELVLEEEEEDVEEEEEERAHYLGPRGKARTCAPLYHSSTSICCALKAVC